MPRDRIPIGTRVAVRAGVLPDAVDGDRERPGEIVGYTRRRSYEYDVRLDRPYRVRTRRNRRNVVETWPQILVRRDEITIVRDAG